MVTITPGSPTPTTIGSPDRGFFMEHEHHHDGDHRVLMGRSYVAWGAVIAGALTALAFLVLMSAFAYAVGLPGYRDGNFNAGTALWAIFSSMLSFFIGGCLVSYLAPHAEQRSGLVHGMLAWVLGVMLMSVISFGMFGFYRGFFDVNTFHAVRPLTTLDTPSHAQIVGAAWTTFFALFLGLICASIGGFIGFTGKLAKLEDKVEHLAHH